MKTIFILLLIFFLSFEFIGAQEQKDITTKRVYTTKFLGQNKAPVIDGLLEDPGWDIVEWNSNFIEHEPDENTEPTLQTRFKIVYDSKNLYVGIRAFDDEPNKIEKRLSRRDGFDGEWVSIGIDSYHDKRTAFIFTVNAVGVKADSFVSDNGDNEDDSWNPIWYTKTNIDNKGWTAEMKIPLSQLRFGKSKEQIWGLQIARHLFRKEEISVWNRIRRDAEGWISESGELHGLLNLEPQKQLEIQPFSVTQFESYPKDPGDPFRDGSDFKLNGGLDAKIGITNDLTLDLTVNPDFGQVEADPGAISLDGFEIFFREQRPFFIENKNIFDFRLGGNRDNLFFSRRIGRSPQGDPEISDNEFIDQPANTTILGAAKFSGKTKNGWSIGILESLTSKEYAEIDNNSDRREELVEPLTNYFLGRLQKDFNNRNSFIGGIFTATNRKIEDNLDLLRTAAYTGGLDFKHHWKNRKYYIEGNLIMSHVKGSKEAITETQESLTHLFQRVDAGHVEVDTDRTSLTGTSGKMEFGKSSVGHFRYGIGASWRSPELELNDIGFLRQADEIRQFAWLNYRSLKPFGNFRSIAARFHLSTTYDFDGNHNNTQYRFIGEANFKNNWWSEVGLFLRPRNYSNTALRGGPRYRFSKEIVNFFFFGTDSRKKLKFRAGYVYAPAKQKSSTFLELNAGLTYQPLKSFSISINPQFEKRTDKTQYVDETNFDGTPRYITAEIDQQTLSASLRLNYTINPDLTIQYYGQPFISRGRYNNFNYITNPVANDLYDRFKLFSDDQITFDQDNESYLVNETPNDGITDYEFEDPNFSFVQFRSNLVLRWEYIPGSEVFLVWSQGLNGDGDPKDHLFRSLDNQIIGQKKDNIFLIKATYRFML